MPLGREPGGLGWRAAGHGRCCRRPSSAEQPLVAAACPYRRFRRGHREERCRKSDAGKKGLTHRNTSSLHSAANVESEAKAATCGGQRGRATPHCKGRSCHTTPSRSTSSQREDAWSMPGLVVQPFTTSARLRVIVVLHKMACHLSSLRGWRCAARQMAGRSIRDGCRVAIDMSISN